MKNVLSIFALVIVTVFALVSCSSSEVTVSVDEDGYIIVNGVKTEYEVKNTNHMFGEWVLYNEDEKDCEKKLYYRVCADCSDIEWRPGKYDDHAWDTVTATATCESDGYDKKTCTVCGKVEVSNETPAVQHTYQTVYTSDEISHWYKCENCDAKKDEAEHSIGVSGECSLCKIAVSPTEGVDYDISEDGTYAMVIGYNGTSDKVRIANEYNGLPVTTIYRTAFATKNITSVIIPDSVTTIGESAFSHCSDLTSIRIPDGVTSIGEGTFYSCSNLTSVTIPDSVTSIGARAFAGCSGLTSVVIPNSVTTIGEFAFDGCRNLKDLTIPDSVASIGVGAFRMLDDSLYSEYENCQYLRNGDNPYFALIDVLNNNYRTYTIHSDTKVITGELFSYCDRLTSIEIPDGVTSISDRAFIYCYNLTNVTIGDSVTSIGVEAFFECSNLTNVTIGNSVTSIGEEAFAGCKNLTSVTIPDGVTSVGEFAFASCSNLTSVTIPDSVTSIGEYAFVWCSNLASIKYRGTQAEWNAISIGDNCIANNVSITYNYSGE